MARAKKAPEAAPAEEAPTDTTETPEGAPDLTEMPPEQSADEALAEFRAATAGLSEEEVAAVLALVEEEVASEAQIEDDDGAIDGDLVAAAFAGAIKITHLRWRSEMGITRPDFIMRDFDRDEIRDMRADELKRLVDSPWYEITFGPAD